MHYLATPISVNISALISFFNDPTLEDHDDLDPIRTHAGSIKGLFAEELLLELLVHKLQEEGGSAEKLAEKCNVGKSGHRLDAWILAGDTLFQVEVKSWSAHGFGGKYNEGLSRSATWERLWNSESGQFRPPPLQKVLEKMKVPDRFKDHKVQPLACLWSAGAPDDSHSSLFSVARPNSNDDGFDTIWVFDAYEYLEAKRKNGEATIDLNLPQLGQRLAYLDAIFTRTPAAEPA